jgi:hypothetical protein
MENSHWSGGGAGVRLRRYAVCAFVVFLITGGFNACDIEVPATDTTPPQVCFYITGDGLTEMISAETGYKSVTLDRDKSYALTAFAFDTDGGVRMVRVTGAITVQCYDEVNGVTRYNDVPYYEQAPSSPVDLEPGEIGKTGMTVQLKMNVEGNDFDCPNGWRFVSAFGTFMADAENYGDPPKDYVYTPFLSVEIE